MIAYKKNRLAGAIAMLLIGNNAFAATICVDPKKASESCKATIQEAIDAAANGDTIKIAAGIYNESPSINKPNLTLAGAGCSTRIEACDTNHCDNTGVSVNSQGITIQKIAIGHASPAILVNNADNLSVAGNCFYDNNQDIEGSGNKATISKNLFNGGRGDSIELQGNEIILENNKVASTDNGFYIQGNDAEVTANSLTLCNDAAINIVGNNAKVQKNKLVDCAGSITVEGDNPDIENNRSDHSGGIYVDCSASDNDIKTCNGGFVKVNKIINAPNDDSGVDARGSKLEISNNTISGTGENGIYFEGDDGIISKNNIAKTGSESSEESGITIRGSDNTIDSNKINSAFFAGIRHDSGDNNTYLNNTINKSGRSGIYIRSGSGNKLENNKSMGNLGEGIANSGTGTIIDKNTVKGNKTDICNEPGASINGGLDSNNFVTGGADIQCQVDNEPN